MFYKLKSNNYLFIRLYCLIGNVISVLGTNQRRRHCIVLS